jgi:hypothetical protein
LVKTYQNGKYILNDYKIYQMAIKYTKWPKNTRNGRKIFQHFTFRDPPKYTQIGIFGMKIYHLATPLES